VTATIAGLERRIQGNCLFLTEHYLQAIAVRECASVFLFLLSTTCRRYGSVEN